MRSFDLEVINKKDGTKKTTLLKDCKFNSLKEFVLKVAEECRENEDEEFVSLKISQGKRVNN